MTTEELDAAITAFRKETEDLTLALIKDIFNIQYGEDALVEGVKSIALTDPYEDEEDYEVSIFSALDEDGTDIKNSLTITQSSAAGFTITSDRAGTVRWQTARRQPKINFWTAS